MTCPHCRKEIPDSEIAKHLARKGGRMSKRTITPDQQRKMQERAQAWRMKNQREKS
jgi:hypothetical protein